MGHWEQIGRNGADEGARRAIQYGWRRGATFYGMVAFLAIMRMAAIAAMLRLFGLF